MDAAVKTQICQQCQRNFLEFMEKFQLNGDFYYMDQAKTMVREGKCTMYVKMSHLTMLDPETVTFEPNDLREIIQSRYLIVCDALNAAVPELLQKLEEPDLQANLQKLRESPRPPSFTVSLYDLPTYSGLRDLRTEKLGHLVTMCGTVTRTTETKPELLVATWQCSDCNREVSGVEQQFKVTHPAVCPSRNCGNRSRWQLLAESRTTKWGDWQRVRLQENENEVPAGSMPRSMDVIVRGEMCERCKPGDKVMVTGSLIVVPEVPSLMSPSELKEQVRRSLNTRTDASYGGADGVNGLRGLGNRDLTYKLAFYGNFVDEDSGHGWGSDGTPGESVRSDDKVYLSQSDKDKFQQISQHVGASGSPDCFDVLARAIAPAVHGHLEVKKGILLMLVGGVPKKTDEGIKLRGDINVCVLGDPATAKSALLKWTSNFLPRAVFASGKSSTAAGLTASVVKDGDLDGERVIEPGALMLSDNGVCCIDEFELMDAKDQVAIHEAMEQQTITLSKAGIQATLMARASILAACLPKHTFYQASQPLHKNVDMSPPIASRFDLMHVIQDVHDEAVDNRVAEHILALHRRRETDVNGPSQLSQLDLQRYIRLARTFKPRITPEARSLLSRCYRKLREDRSHSRGGWGVTVRQLECLIRLAEAVARIHLDEEVTKEHAQMAWELKVSTQKRAEREDIDLNPDLPEEAPTAPDAARPEGGDAPAALAEGSRPKKKSKISFQDYQRIGQMLAAHLKRENDEGKEVTEEDLTGWYIEQIEEEIQTEQQLIEKMDLIGHLIKRLIEKDRVLIIYRQSDNPAKPELRVLVKHPNYPVGDDVISGARGRD